MDAVEMAEKIGEAVFRRGLENGPQSGRYWVTPVTVLACARENGFAVLEPRGYVSIVRLLQEKWKRTKIAYIFTLEGENLSWPAPTI